MDRTTPRPRLITIPLSHYCEKARWALDCAGVDYVEERHVPLLHRSRTKKVGAKSVPVLVTAARTYADSGSIVRYADEHSRTSPLLPRNASLRQEAVELELYLDRELGPHARRWAYGELLDHASLLQPHFTSGAPTWERLVAPVALMIARPMIRSGYRVDPDSARLSLERVRDVFRWIDDKLSDDRPYLVGEGFGAADITFASLAAPLLLPPNYGGSFPALEDVPESTRHVVHEFRATRPGRFALAMYQSHRRRAPTPA
jgi:glutathione S-transferase